MFNTKEGEFRCFGIDDGLANDNVADIGDGEDVMVLIFLVCWLE